MKLAIRIAMLAGFAFLSPLAAAAADLSPIPTGASLGYLQPLKGDGRAVGILSWNIVEKPVWNRLKLDLLFYERPGTSATANVTLGLGVDFIEPTKRLHIGATGLLPGELGHGGFYLVYQLF